MLMAINKYCSTVDVMSVQMRMEGEGGVTWFGRPDWLCCGGGERAILVMSGSILQCSFRPSVKACEGVGGGGGHTPGESSQVAEVCPSEMCV